MSRERLHLNKVDTALECLSAALPECAHTPETGMARHDVRDGSRARVMRRHVIGYTVHDEHGIVQRVLHGAMEPGRHLR